MKYQVQVNQLKYEQIKEENQKIKDNYSISLSQVKLLNDQKIQQKGVLKNKEDNIQGREGVIKETTRQSDELLLKIDSLNQRILDLETNGNLIENQLRFQIGSLNQTIEKLKETQIYLQQQLIEKNKLNEQLVNYRDEVRTQLQEKQKRYVTIEAQLNELQKFEDMMGDLNNRNNDFIENKERYDLLSEKFKESEQIRTDLKNELQLEKKQFKEYKNKFEKQMKLQNEEQNRRQSVQIQSYYDGLLFQASKERMEYTLKDMQKLQVQIDQKDELIGTIQENFSHLRNKVIKNEIKNPQQEQKIAVLHGKLQQMEVTQMKQKTEIQVLLQQLETQRHYNNNLKIKTKQFDRQNSRLIAIQQRLEMKDESIVRLVKDSNFKSDEIETLQNIIRELNDAVKKLNDKQYAEVQGGQVRNAQNIQLENFRIKFEIQKRGNEELIKLYQKIEEMNEGQDVLFQSTMVQNPTDVIVSLRMDVKKKEKRIRVQDDQVINLNLKAEKSKEFIRIQETQINELKLRYEEKNQKTIHLKGEISSIKQSLNINERQHLHLNSKFKQQSQDVQVLSQKFDDLRKQKNKLLMTIDEINYQLDQKNERELKLENDLNEVLKQNELLEEENTKLEEDVIKNAEEFIEKAGLVVDNKVNLQNKIKELQNSLESKKVQLLDNQRKNLNLKKQMNMKEKQYLGTIDQKNQMIILLKDSKGDINNETLLQYQSTQDLLQKIDEKNSEIAQLKEDLIIFKNREGIQMIEDGFDQEPLDIMSPPNEKIIQNAINNQQMPKEKWFNSQIPMIRTKEGHELCLKHSEDLRDQLNMLISENNSLQRQNDKLQEIIDQQKEMSIEQKMDKHNLIRSHLGEEHKLETLKNELKLQNLKLYKKVEQIKRLSSEKTKLLKYKMDLEDDFKEIQKKNDYLRNENVELLQRCGNVETRLEAFELSKDANIGETNVKLLEVLTTKDEYQKKMLQIKDKEIARLKKYEEVGSSSPQKIEDLKSQIQQLKRKVETVQEQIKKSKENSEQTTNQYNEILKSHRDKEQKITSLHKKIDQLEITIEEKIEEIFTHQLRIKKTETMLQNEKRLLNSFKQDKLQLNEQIKEMNKQMDKKFTEFDQKVILRNKNKEIEDLKKQLEKSHQIDVNQNVLKQKLIEQVKDLKDKKQLITVAEIEKTSLKDEIEQKLIEIKHLKNQQKYLDQKFKNEERKLEEFKDQLSIEENNKMRLQQYVFTLIQERETLESENFDFQHKLEDEFKNVRTTFKDTISHIADELEVKQRKIDSLSNKLRVLQMQVQ